MRTNPLSYRVRNPYGYLAVQAARGAMKVYPYAKHAPAAVAAYAVKKFYVNGKLTVAKYKKQGTIKNLKIGQKYLKKRIRNNEGIITYRNRTIDSIVTSGINTCIYSNVDGNSTTLTELALAELRYYDPANPGTYIQSDLSAGTNYKQTICRSFSTYTVMNNFQIPCKISLYKCIPKLDTQISTTAAITNGFADVGGLAVTNPQTFPTDSNQFVKLWKVVKTIKKVLYPGQICKLTHASKEFSYDPSFVDSHNFVYQRKYGAHAYLIKVEGLLSHDTAVTTQNATTQGGVDIQCDRTIKVTYDAGIDLKFFVAVSNADVLTNGAVLSQVVKDNQNFSRS